MLDCALPVESIDSLICLNVFTFGNHYKVDPLESKKHQWPISAWEKFKIVPKFSN